MGRRPVSLRLKLTLWYFLVFSLVQIGFAAVIFLREQDEIIPSVRKDMAESADWLIENILIQEDGSHPLYWDRILPTDGNFVFCVIRRPDGQVVDSWNIQDVTELELGPKETTPAGMLQPQFFRMKPDLARQITGQAGDYLAVTVPFRSPGDSVGDLRYLQAGVERYAFSLGPYRPLLTIGLPTGLFVALVASQLIARRAVSPIQRLSVAAQSVSSTSFSERIRVPTTDNEISKLQHELNSALERLEQGYRAQEQFIANVSHELKTPIAVVLTESQVVKLGAENLPKYREYVDRVEEEMQRLGALVESFLTLTRFEMATEQPFHDPVSINDVILDSIGHCNGYAQRKGIQVVPFLLAPSSDDVDPLVVGDQDILRTMLDNLVRNAVRHSPANGSVQIEASLRGDEIAVEVRDQGPGIPEEFLDKIFDRFVQVPRDGTKRRGTGIGLAIAQNIAHLHRGVITAANNENGGCTFRISLPAHRPAPEEPAGRPGSDAVA